MSTPTVRGQLAADRLSLFAYSLRRRRCAQVLRRAHRVQVAGHVTNLVWASGSDSDDDSPEYLVAQRNPPSRRTPCAGEPFEGARRTETVQPAARRATSTVRVANGQLGPDSVARCWIVWLSRDTVSRSSATLVRRACASSAVKPEPSAYFVFTENPGHKFGGEHTRSQDAADADDNAEELPVRRRGREVRPVSMRQQAAERPTEGVPGPWMPEPC